MVTLFVVGCLIVVLAGILKYIGRGTSWKLVCKIGGELMKPLAWTVVKLIGLVSPKTLDRIKTACEIMIWKWSI